MPLCSSLSLYKGLWELRSDLTHSRIARVLFCLRKNQLILLHGFIKKTRKTPLQAIEIAVKRMKG
ncbi:MAG: type II toxin-antitoxin system RelE/ParE family toxin [Candidatus Anammoxibacter sp.]